MARAKLFHPQKKATQQAYAREVVFSKLGMIRTSRGDIVRTTRSGYPFIVIEKLADAIGTAQKELLPIINLSSPTLARRRSRGDKLKPQESDNVYRVASAYRDALELFEADSDAAKNWLHTPAKALGGETPFSLLDTQAGADQVRDLIGRLEHGVYT